MAYYDDAGGYGSELEGGVKRKRFSDIGPTEKQQEKAHAQHQEHVADMRDRVQRLVDYEQCYESMNAFQRHMQMVQDYQKYYGKSPIHVPKAAYKNDYDIIAEEHRFVWTEKDLADMSWEKRLAKRYYDKLVKEYCTVDLSQYKTGRIGMRWRVEAEVFAGNGQFSCGNIVCDEREGLSVWEVNFSYNEHGEQRSALVKVALCAKCSKKLNYTKKHTQVVPSQPDPVS